MKEEEFYNTVKDMRELQIKYFRSRNIIVLKKAKILEKKVDDFIKEDFYKKRRIENQAEEIHELFENC